MKKYQETIIIGLLVILVVAAGIIIYLVQKDDDTQVLPNHAPDITTEQKTQSQSPHETTKEQAEKIVLDKYGGEIKETESDHYHGKEAWEVEVRNSKEGRIEVKVDKSTGEILDMEKD